MDRRWHRERDHSGGNLGIHVDAAECRAGVVRRDALESAPLNARPDPIPPPPPVTTIDVAPRRCGAAL